MLVYLDFPELKSFTGHSCSMRRKAGDSLPERQESIQDTEASKRAGSKKRESCGYMYIAKSKITRKVFLKCLSNMYMYFYRDICNTQLHVLCITESKPGCI